MAEVTTPQGEPDTWFAKIDRRYLVFESALNAVAAVGIFCLMILAVTEVLMRRLFNSPIHGQADLVEIMIPTIGFFGLAYCHRLAGHVRMELLLHQLKGRALWIAELIGTVATMGIVAAMIWGTYGHFERAYRLGDTSMDANFHVWPPKLIITLGFCVLFLRLIIVVFGYLRLIRDPGAIPIGVPIRPTIEEEAVADAEAALEDGDDVAREGR